MLEEISLLYLFVNCVAIAVGAEFLQFEAVGGVSAVFGCSVARYARRSLIAIGAAFGTF